MLPESGTKHLIFTVSADLFSLKGFHDVSMKEIAQRVGIKAASIYGHYASKEDILNDIFDFYEANREGSLPRLEDLLAMVGKEHPYAILRRMQAVYPRDTLPVMAQAMRIASSLSSTNKRAQNIMDSLVHLSESYDRPLLQKMVDMGEIEQVDIEHFALLHTSFNYSAAVRAYADRRIGTKDYTACLDLLFQLIRPTEQANRR